MRTAIVTDSTAYISAEERARLNIHMIPLSVNISGQLFEEEVDITASEFYDKVRGAKEFPKTTQPPIGEFVALFEELAKEYDEVISIHLSSGISGTYQGAIQAGEMVEGIDVSAFDSEISCAVQGFYVLRAAELAAQGLSAKEIHASLEEMKQSVRAYFIVDDLAHLQRGGRLSAAAALIGGLLQVKPILHFADKVIVPFEKIRTRKKALKRAEELLAEDAKKYEAMDAVVIHGNCLAEAEEWLAQLAATYPNVNFKMSYFGPVIGTHLGEGSMGLGWTKKY
ncbi:DegV domain-containing protein [Lysinibacillus sphaericus]|uniref:DegV family protein n=1 Tax=Lysinibacillus sphaericus TaxID=1421 RepID=UPI0018CF5987|nr:DegV family protein [Lysinibacillus sphaericus]MBG9454809.1 DegV domain-containing protein [Lysinibacillus sphaericus]MBG9478237.1 DegV domain-containing protein [Lysinibacillus sphaericus]MBG9590950.1 DegV domain-containing protein [Lysinibacillus sphaericus]